jgi:hypothetical protein
MAWTPVRALTGEHLGPLEDARPFDAMLGQSRGVGDGADGECGGRGEHGELPGQLDSVYGELDLPSIRSTK